MSWGTAADIATTVGVLIALAGVVVSSVLTLRSERVTRRGQQLERQQAEATAARTEAAAALTEEYTRRVVDALETMASKEPVAPGAVSAHPRGVRWTMSHHGGDTYLLTNVGDRTAHSVSLFSDPTLPLMDAPEGVDMRPDEGATFMAAPDFGTVDRTVTVRWENEAGEERDWRFPLPPRPR